MFEKCVIKDHFQSEKNGCLTFRRQQVSMQTLLIHPITNLKTKITLKQDLISSKLLAY